MAKGTEQFGKAWLHLANGCDKMTEPLDLFCQKVESICQNWMSICQSMANGRICFGKVAATRFGKVLSGWQNGHSRWMEAKLFSNDRSVVLKVPELFQMVWYVDKRVPNPIARTVQYDTESNVFEENFFTISCYHMVHSSQLDKFWEDHLEFMENSHSPFDDSIPKKLNWMDLGIIHANIILNIKKRKLYI